MTYFEHFRRSVSAQIGVGQIGKPLFARLVLAVDADHGRLLHTVAEGAALVADLLQTRVQRVFTAGSVESGHLSLQLELDQGRNALVAVALQRSDLPRVDLLLVGNHGTLFHESNDETLAQEFLDEPDAVFGLTSAGQELERAARESLTSGTPVQVSKS